MWPLGSAGHWQSSWWAEVAAEDTRWALLSSIGSSHFLSAHQCSVSGTCTALRTAKAGCMVVLQKFLSYISLCCSRAIPDLHTGAVEKMRIRAVTPLHWYPCYYKDFSLELVAPILLGCHNPACLTAPSQSNKCHSSSMSRAQKERGLWIRFIIYKN